MESHKPVAAEEKGLNLTKLHALSAEEAKIFLPLFFNELVIYLCKPFDGNIKNFDYYFNCYRGLKFNKNIIALKNAIDQNFPDISVEKAINDILLPAYRTIQEWGIFTKLTAGNPIYATQFKNRLALIINSFHPLPQDHFDKQSDMQAHENFKQLIDMLQNPLHFIPKEQIARPATAPITMQSTAKVAATMAASTKKAKTETYSKEKILSAINEAIQFTHKNKVNKSSISSCQDILKKINQLILMSTNPDNFSTKKQETKFAKQTLAFLVIHALVDYLPRDIEVELDQQEDIDEENPPKELIKTLQNSLVKLKERILIRIDKIKDDYINDSFLIKQLTQFDKIKLNEAIESNPNLMQKLYERWEKCIERDLTEDWETDIDKSTLPDPKKMDQKDLEGIHTCYRKTNAAGKNEHKTHR